MSTEKLYYQDTRLFEFTAALVYQQQEGREWHVRLDRSAFYPEAGGQPADRGWLNDIPVVGVREEAGDLLHILDSELTPGGPGTEVRGRVDAARRLDYMQQHTGQHIISAALVRQGAYPTVSIHMGDDTTTVEIDAPGISEADLEAVEEAANRVICRNLPVRTPWVSREQAAGLSLRRPPPDREQLRLVEIEGFDLCACGGTHLDTTGEVGLVKAVGAEKIRGRVRLYWKIGRRAYRDYHEKTALAARLGQLLSARNAEIPGQVENLLARSQRQARENTALEERLAAELAASLTAGAERWGKALLIAAGLEEESQTLVRLLAGTLLKEPYNAVCITNHSGGRLHWLAGRGEGLDLDLGALLKPLLPLIGGRGGGREGRWQGSGEKPEGRAVFLESWRENARRVLGGQA
jgi:alanyl-tRNA synthetase